MPIAVIGLVIDAMRKSVSFSIGRFAGERALAGGFVVDDAIFSANHRDRTGEIAALNELPHRRLDGRELVRMGDRLLGGGEADE